MAPAAKAAIRPHVITLHLSERHTRYYVRSDHAADVYYRVESIYGWLTCTCPAGQQHIACKHLAAAVRC